MIYLGKTARHLRESLGLSQRAAAKQLNISCVHLCNIENNKAMPSPVCWTGFESLGRGLVCVGLVSSRGC